MRSERALGKSPEVPSADTLEGWRGTGERSIVDPARAECAAVPGTFAERVEGADAAEAEGDPDDRKASIPPQMPSSTFETGETEPSPEAAEGPPAAGGAVQDGARGTQSRGPRAAGGAEIPENAPLGAPAPSPQRAPDDPVGAALWKLLSRELEEAAPPGLRTGGEGGGEAARELAALLARESGHLADCLRVEMWRVVRGKASAIEGRLREAELGFREATRRATA